MNTAKPETATVHQATTDRSALLRVTVWIMRHGADVLFMKTTMKVTVTGIENVPRTGPVIILFNHLTFFDPIPVACGIPVRHMIPLGKKELYDNLLFRWAYWGWGAIPVKRGEVDRTALKRAMIVIESNDMLMIAPEGTRQKHGMHDPKEGIVLLATKAGATLVPVGVSGTENYVSNLKRLRRTPITINVGKPFRIKTGVNRKQYMQVAHEIMYQIAPLAAPHLRGDYADLSKATADTLEMV